MSYLVNWNMPGFMPDCEGIECDSLEKAKEVLLSEIAFYLEDMDLDDRFTQEEVKQNVKYMEDIEKAKPQELNAKIGHYNFYITSI